jgi:hypothetical protein
MENNLVENVLKRLRKYRSEILIAIICGLLVAGVVEIVKFALPEPKLWVNIAVGSPIIFLLLIIVFRQKYLLESRLAQLDQLLYQRFGFSSLHDRYFIRNQHFAVEKELLARVFVRSVLPSLISQVKREHSHFTAINLILDSGTTITPIFPHLIACGIPLESEKIRIYTNNLAGIDEIHRLDLDYPKLTERDFNLLGGKPLNEYRATTGSETIEAVLRVCGNHKQGERVITIAVVTANWLLAGPALDNLCLCARGTGHFEFKKILIERSDYVVVIAPLGKILYLGRNEYCRLNEWISSDSDPYPEPLVLPHDKKNTCFLLTSLRSTDSQSLLAHASFALKALKNNPSSSPDANYIIHPKCPTFDLPVVDKEKLAEFEVPHKYVRQHIAEAYQKAG